MTKRWVHRNLRDDGMIGGSEIPIYAQELTRYVLESDHEQALAEKDMGIDQLKRAYRQELSRHKDTIHDLIVRQAADSAAYQQLMGKAVSFARWIVNDQEYHMQIHVIAADFLASPEVQAFLKERGHGIP